MNNTNSKLIDVIIDDLPKPDLTNIGYFGYYCELIYEKHADFGIPSFKICDVLLPNIISKYLKSINKYHFIFNSEFTFNNKYCTFKNKKIIKVEKINNNQVKLLLKKIFSKKEVIVDLEEKYIDFLCNY